MKQNKWNLLEKIYAIAEFPNDFNPANLSNPSSPRITNQLSAGGAGGRGEALGIYIYIYTYYILYDYNISIYYIYI